LNTKILSIAGFRIKIKSDLLFNLDEGHIPFIVKEDSNEDILVELYDKDIINKIPENKIFESANDKLKIFAIFKIEDGYKIIIYNQQDNNKIQQVAYVDEDFYNWKVIISEELINDALKYPLGPLLLYYLTIKNEAIMIHGSAVSDGEKGKLFTGVSGSGKTTIASIYRGSGYKIINDDRLIIKKDGNNYYIYNTPMYYADDPKKTLLTSVNLIYHSKENISERLKGAIAVTNIMANCIQHSYNKRYIQHHLDFLSELCNKIPVYKVGFKPDKSIVEFLNNDKR
jgi:hypothetical protein